MLVTTTSQGFHTMVLYSVKSLLRPKGTVKVGYIQIWTYPKRRLRGLNTTEVKKTSLAWGPPSDLPYISSHLPAPASSLLSSLPQLIVTSGWGPSDDTPCCILQNCKWGPKVTVASVASAHIWQLTSGYYPSWEKHAIEQCRVYLSVSVVK